MIINYKEIPMDKIFISKDCSRKSNRLEKIYELAQNIKEIGLLQPVVVYSENEKGMYELIIGTRRFEACKILGWKKIPACINIDVPKKYEETIRQALLEDNK